MNSLSMARKSRVEAAASSAIWPYLQLMRPPNLITAAADILAGYAVAGLPDPRALPWLLAAAVGLYGGGVVFNDFFDAELDGVEFGPSGRFRAGASRSIGRRCSAAFFCWQAWRPPFRRTRSAG